jgi:UDP-glucose 4-epimerase
LDSLGNENIDIVFHLAGQVGQELSFNNPIYDVNANSIATLRLLKWSAENDVKQFIFTSSMNVYGDSEVFPITEDCPVNPPSPYAVGKISSEYFCKIFQNFGLPTTCFRLFNVYGPGQDMHYIVQGMVRIFMSFVAKGEPILVRGSPERFRDFVSVHDVVEAFLLAVDEKAYGGIYNISTGRRTDVRELLDLIIDAFGYDPKDYPVVYGEPTTNDQFGAYGDSRRIREDLAWIPKVGLEEGIKEMAKWAKKNVQDIQ